MLIRLTHPSPMGSMFSWMNFRSQPVCLSFSASFQTMLPALFSWRKSAGATGLCAPLVGSQQIQPASRLVRSSFGVESSLLGIASGAESPTYAELYSGKWRHHRFGEGSTTSSG